MVLSRVPAGQGWLRRTLEAWRRGLPRGGVRPASLACSIRPRNNPKVNDTRERLPLVRSYRDWYCKLLYLLPRAQNRWMV